jgi:type II secretory pathway pseudopilin PulG
VRRSQPGWPHVGATLVELAVVIAISSMLLALAFGGSSLIAGRRLMGAARMLAGDVRMVEQRARAERTCYRIIFEAGAEAYVITRYEGLVTAAPPGGGSMCTGATWSGPQFVERAGDRVSRRMPRSVDLVSTTFVPGDVLQFSPLGNPNGGTVTLRASTGLVRQVVVEGMGRVRILP